MDDIKAAKRHMAAVIEARKRRERLTVQAENEERILKRRNLAELTRLAKSKGIKIP